MRRIAIAAAALAISLLTYFQFPGHTWLQQDSQIYVPVLENQYDHAVLRNDILVKQSHLAYTLYDDVALLPRRFSGFGYREILAVQQIVARAVGVWGLFLIAQALGLSLGPAVAAALIVSLGAAIAGPAVLTTEYEPTPRAIALPLIYAAMGLAAHRRYLAASILGSIALLYHFPAALPFWILFGWILLRERRFALLGVPAIAAVLLSLGAEAPGGSYITPMQEQLQRMRTAYVWISTWPWQTVMHHVLVAAIAGAAFYRVRGKVRFELRVLLPGLVAIGLLSMPLSWLMLEQSKLALAPQLQPLRWLLSITLVMQLLAVAAGALAKRRVEAAVWFTLAYLPVVQSVFLIAMPWKRLAVVVGLGVLTALAKRFAAVPALAAFVAIPMLAGVVNYPALHTPELAELSRWARLNTDRDAVFLFADAGRSLLPGIFRSEARRAVYVDWKGGGQVNYLPEFGEEWWRRWQETAGKQFDPGDVPKYAGMGITYVVLQPDHRQPRAADFENAKWLVYRSGD